MENFLIRMQTRFHSILEKQQIPQSTYITYINVRSCAEQDLRSVVESIKCYESCNYI